MADYELAQLNVAETMAPLESPLLADFVAGLDRINALAEAADGYVWRLQTDEGDATALRPFGEDMLINLSVWRDVEALKAFVYGPEHIAIMRRRREWFSLMPARHLVLWWVPAGHRPDTAEAWDRLTTLRERGPSPEAFDFRQPFPSPGTGDPT
jgi:hypothetical protein